MRIVYFKSVLESFVYSTQYVALFARGRLSCNDHFEFLSKSGDYIRQDFHWHL